MFTSVLFWPALFSSLPCLLCRSSLPCSLCPVRFALLALPCSLRPVRFALFALRGWLWPCLRLPVLPVMFRRSISFVQDVLT